MKFGRRKKNDGKPALPAVQTAARDALELRPVQLYSYTLFEQVRRTVPIVDAAIYKLIRLIGSFQIECADASAQAGLDSFLRIVPVGLTG
ncbi:MAG: serine/threonine protein phosphatase, partial [Oscillospiraceae bacterium]|nr:serine/threonine protein phosphatase [Oscillospiraceae bacterium]